MSRRFDDVRRRILPAYTAIMHASLLLPVAVMILFGFNRTNRRFNYTWHGFTLRWYRQLFAVPEVSTEWG